MWISWMLFSLRGRIRRRDWWVATIVLGLLQAFGEYVIYSKSYPGFAPDDYAEAASPPASIALGLLFLWPALALAVKREHDRDGTGWVAVGVLALATATAMLPEFVGLPDIVELLLTLTGLAALLFLLVRLGVLEGTSGPNRFGPSPKRFDVAN